MLHGPSADASAAILRFFIAVRALHLLVRFFDFFHLGEDVPLRLVQLEVPYFGAFLPAIRATIALSTAVVVEHSEVGEDTLADDLCDELYLLLLAHLLNFSLCG